MKYLIIIILAILLAGILVGCSNPMDSNPSKDGNSNKDNIPNKTVYPIKMIVNSQVFEGNFVTYDKDLRAIHLHDNECGITVFIQDIETLIIETN